MSKTIHTQVYESVSQKGKKCSEKILLWPFWDIQVYLQFYLCDHELADRPETVFVLGNAKMRKHTVSVPVRLYLKMKKTKTYINYAL